MTTTNRQLAIALCLATAGFALSQPAAAQFHDFFRNPLWGGGGGGYYQNPSPFNPYNPFYPRPQPPAESIRPPAPHKVETPPTQTVVVIGDSLADWLGYGLEEALADTPEIGVVRKIKPYSGLVRYEARADSPDWSQAIKDVLAPERPAAIVIMLGVNDRLPLRDRAPRPGATASPPGAGATPAAPAAADTAPADNEQPASAAGDAPRRPPGGNYDFHTERWAELYAKRIDEMIAVLKGKGVPVLWVGMPAIRGAKSTSDMSYLDELYRARADKAGIIYVDIWDGFVDERGNYAQQGPDFQGQTRRLRTYDGVHFTKAGAEKLAHYVEHELRRVLTNRVLPVALPGPEELSPAKGNARPAVGPVVPLNAISGGEGGDLLGAANRPAQHEGDPVATQVLSRGEPIAAPPGRADDFSWPRADGNSSADVAPAAPLAPPAPKGAPGKKDANKGDANKGDANKGVAPPAAPKTAPVKPPRQSRDDLDGGPQRPPPAAGPAATNGR